MAFRARPSSTSMGTHESDGSGPQAGNPPEIIRLALRPPALRPDAVSRATLLQRLPAEPEHLCTLIQAPAGYGKTTLAVQWLTTGRNRPVAWMTVNEAHNDPVSFWTTATAAIGEVAPGFGASYESVLTQAGARIHDVVLP